MIPLFKKDHHDDHHDEGVVEVLHDEPSEHDVGQVAVDILEKETSYIVIAPLAGVSIDGIDIAISRNVLTISGERTRPDVYAEVEKALIEECFFGQYSRSIILPENLAFNKIKATMENNLLIVEIPKLTFPSKTIKIDKLER